MRMLCTRYQYGTLLYRNTLSYVIRSQNSQTGHCITCFRRYNVGYGLKQGPVRQPTKTASYIFSPPHSYREPPNLLQVIEPTLFQSVIYSYPNVVPVQHREWAFIHPSTYRKPFISWAKQGRKKPSEPPLSSSFISQRS